MGKIYLILKNTPRFFKKQLYFTTYRNLEIGLQGFNPGIYIPTDVKQKKKRGKRDDVTCKRYYYRSGTIKRINEKMLIREFSSFRIEDK